VTDERKKTFIAIKFISHLTNQTIVCIFLINITTYYCFFEFSYMKKLHFKYEMFYCAKILVLRSNNPAPKRWFR
jgi:hypothetical protein